MDTSKLQKFDLSFPGHWIAGANRKWAFDTALILRHIENSFIEAVAAFSLFRPITKENIETFLAEWQSRSRYEGCLNGLYAKAFVYSLDAIEKLLSRLCRDLSAPASVKLLHQEYQQKFGHLKHIRDSAIHIEDRGRGINRRQSPIETNLLVLGSFIGNRFTFTGEDGKMYEIKISETPLICAHQILQGVINAYIWE